MINTTALSEFSMYNILGYMLNKTDRRFISKYSAQRSHVFDSFFYGIFSKLVGMFDSNWEVYVQEQKISVRQHIVGKSICHK